MHLDCFLYTGHDWAIPECSDSHTRCFHMHTVNSRIWSFSSYTHTACTLHSCRLSSNAHLIKMHNTAIHLFNVTAVKWNVVKLLLHKNDVHLHFKTDHKMYYIWKFPPAPIPQRIQKTKSWEKKKFNCMKKKQWTHILVSCTRLKNTFIIVRKFIPNSNLLVSTVSFVLFHLIMLLC